MNCSHLPISQIGQDPCGFCGASGCTTRLIIQGGRRRVESNCHFYTSFKYGSAKKSTASSPSTNIPIHCPHCKSTIWKYNTVDHLASYHSELDTANLNKQFIVDIQIQKQEELWMKILPELTDAYRGEHSNLFLSEEDVSTMERECEEEDRRGKKRSRGTGSNLKGGATKRQRCR